MISLKRTLEGNNLELVFQDDGPGVFFHMIPETGIQPAVFGKAVHKADQVGF